MFYITVSNGLLTKEHRDKIGSSVWEFMWCIDKVTKVDDEGFGWVLGGKPIKLEEINSACRDTVSRNLNKLQRQGYLRLIRTPYGISIRVAKAKKKFGRRLDDNVESKRLDDNVESLRKNVESNKTVQYDNTSKMGNKDLLKENKKTMVWNKNHEEDEIQLDENYTKPQKLKKPRSWTKEDIQEWADSKRELGLSGEIFMEYVIVKEVELMTRLSADLLWAEFKKTAEELAEAYPNKEKVFKAIAYAKANRKPEMWTLRSIIKILPTIHKL